MILSVSEILLMAMIPLAIGYCWYIQIIRRRNAVEEALATIDTQLRQRFDLIPNILRIAAKYMEHEQTLLASITALRTQALTRANPQDADAVQGRFHAVEQLQSQMGHLMVNAEHYPELKSDMAVADAMATYVEAEAQITAARRYYNSAVKEYNNAVQIFPGNIIASMIAAKKMPVFEVAEVARMPIQFMPGGTMDSVALAYDPANSVNTALPSATSSSSSSATEYAKLR